MGIVPLKYHLNPIMNPNVRYDFFNAISPLSHEAFALLCNTFRRNSFTKGAHIVEPGEIQRELHFVNSGVWMSHSDFGDKNVVMAFAYAPGPCAIPDSFLCRKPSEYYLTCLADSETESVSYDDLHRVFDQSQALERLFRKLTEAILAGMISRHTELHTQSIEERFVAFCRRSPQLLQQVPHKYLAAYLGINATNFSKLFNRIRI